MLYVVGYVLIYMYIAAYALGITHAAACCTYHYRGRP